MPLSSVPVAPACELPLVSPRQVLTPHVYRSYSPREVTLSPHKVVSTQPWETCTRMTGGGTCTTPSRAQIGLEIRMLSTT